MKTGRIIVGIVVFVLLLTLAAALSLAQEPDAAEGEADLDAAGLAAVVDSSIPIQGQLTDALGNPLNGNFSIRFRLYDAETGGTSLCEDTNSVTVEKGLFYSEIAGTCGADEMDGRALYLGIKVKSDAEMTPRRAIYPVPYALGLRPGAAIISSAYPVLEVESTHESGRGLRAYASATSGTNYGVVGASWSPDGYGGYFYNASDISNPGFGVAGLHPNYDASDIDGWVHPAGYFGGRIGVIGLSKEAGGTAVVGLIDDDTGWAGLFTGVGNGVRISTPPGKTGLQVVGGTKSAAVDTADGERLLYTEESTEVWFTDYGFGQLVDGAAVISIDPVFAQTVNLQEPYHVFVQVYGDAEVYVSDRTAAAFEVRLRDGDPGVEFSYRIVGKRLGYESDRLEPVPQDAHPELFP